jgi:hypothetical protein
MSEPSEEILAERERIYALVSVLFHGLHAQALSQCLRAIRSGKTRAEMITLGVPWSIGPNGAKHTP